MQPGSSISDNASTDSSQRNARSIEPAGWLKKIDGSFDERSRLISVLVLAGGFMWRLWLAQATFFNTDEAWHYFLANQDSALLAYKASLTISHPPLLILILHGWRFLGTSNLVLRLPAVIAGSVFCWLFYLWLHAVAGRATAWAGLIFAAFLGPLIFTSAEVRQNPLMLLFAMGAAWSLELALERESVSAMWVSSLCLCLAMLSHYSAFFLAGALGVYGIVRILQRRPSAPVLGSWIAGETIGVAVAGYLYKTHLGRLNHLLSGALLPQQYLYSSYFHKGSDHIVPFLYRGTFGVFRFVFGQTQIGQLAVLVFVGGVILAFLGRDSASGRRKGIALGLLLLLPFVLNWLAAAAGFYPYGRMRQCMFLAIFVLAGVSICVARVTRQNAVIAAAIALGIVVLCQVLGTLQDRDALPRGEQRHEHMDELLAFVRGNVGQDDLIFTDQATSYQLRHYLCNQKPVRIEISPAGFENFRCDGFHVLFTGPNDGALTADVVDARWHNADGRLDSTAGLSGTWVIQGGWASGLGQAVQRFPGFERIEIHSFGRYLEVFRLPATATPTPQR